MNTTETNRALVTEIMAALATGDSRPFAAAMSEDFTWRTMAAQGTWRGAVIGRAAVSAYFNALYQQFTERQTTLPQRIFADGDVVIVEAKGGGVKTKRGEIYANTYCLIFTLADGQLTEVREYMDTALADARLDPLPMTVAA